MTIPRALRRRVVRVRRDTGFLAAGIPLHLALVPLWSWMASAATSRAWPGLPLPFVLILLGVVALTAVQRRRYRVLLGVEILRLPAAREQGWLRRALRWLSVAQTWRQAGYHLLVGPLLAVVELGVLAAWVAGLAGVTVNGWAWMLPVQVRLDHVDYATQAVYYTAAGVLLLCAVPWLTGPVTRAETRIALALLGTSRSQQLQQRVEHLSESRTDLIDAVDTERRRIERDLHDGTQQRLVSLAVNLGLAKATLTNLSDEARTRDRRGAPRGEGGHRRTQRPGARPAPGRPRRPRAGRGAVRAGRPGSRSRYGCGRPRRSERRPPWRPLAYFVVSEALTNVAKHAGATRADVTVEPRRRHAARGESPTTAIGGADPSGGTGLRGLADGSPSVDGTFDVEQPRRGPDHHRPWSCRARRDRRGLTSCCGSGWSRCWTMAGFESPPRPATPRRCSRAVEEHRPDVAVVDVRMPPGFTDEGVRAALVIREQCPGTAVLVLSQYVEERYAADLLAANTSGVGYLLKDRVADVEEFVDALRRVAAGGTALDPEVVAQLLVRRRSDPLDRLTPREREVLALMAEGRSNAGDRRQPWSSATARSTSTSTTSSPNSTCPQPTPTTGGFWPS